MKNIFILTIALLSLTSIVAQNEIRFPKEENLILRTSWHYHFKETEANHKGMNFEIAAGYSGAVYAILNYESFSGLKGGHVSNKTDIKGNITKGDYLQGYTSFGGSIGVNLTHGYYEQHKYYVGIRLIRVYRGLISQGWHRHFIGFEAGTSIDITEDIAIGLRGTMDYRYDQEIFGWTVEWTPSAFITITFKLKELGG